MECNVKGLEFLRLIKLNGRSLVDSPQPPCIGDLKKVRAVWDQRVTRTNTVLSISRWCMTSAYSSKEASYIWYLSVFGGRCQHYVGPYSGSYWLPL